MSTCMTPLHEDVDKCISLCCQLEKSGCPDGVLHFAYAKYGIVIETQSNTAWSDFPIEYCLTKILISCANRVFNSTELHGSHMSSFSQMAVNLRKCTYSKASRNQEHYPTIIVGSIGPEVMLSIAGDIFAAGDYINHSNLLNPPSPNSPDKAAAAGSPAPHAHNVAME